MRGELAVELGEQRDAVGDAKLRAGGGERGILRQRRAVADEAVPGQRLEHRRERRVAYMQAAEYWPGRVRMMQARADYLDELREAGKMLKRMTSWFVCPLTAKTWVRVP
jgi:hypothetical protein